jgi:hypothetical protein
MRELHQGLYLASETDARGEIGSFESGLPFEVDPCCEPGGPTAEGRCPGRLVGASLPADQNWSALMISPPPMVPRAHQTGGAIEFLIARTEPSIISMLTRPGCRLEGGTEARPLPKS